MNMLRSILALAGQVLVVACFGMSALGTVAEADDTLPPWSALAALAPAPIVDAPRAPLPPVAPRASGEQLRSTRLVLARSVRSGQPVIEAMSFASGTRVCALVEIANPERVATTVTVSWQRPTGQLQGRGQRLRVPAEATFSTRAFFVPRRPGTWTVIVRRADGEEIMRQEFDVSATRGTVVYANR